MTKEGSCCYRLFSGKGKGKSHEVSSSGKVFVAHAVAFLNVIYLGLSKNCIRLISIF